MLPDEERRAPSRLEVEADLRLRITGVGADLKVGPYDTGGASESANHQAVPRRQHFVVEMRARAHRTSVLQFRARPRERSLHLRARLRGGMHRFVYLARCVDEMFVDELVLRIERRVAVWEDAVAGPKNIRIVSEDFPDLLVAPDVEGTFHLVRRTRRRT